MLWFFTPLDKLIVMLINLLQVSLYLDKFSGVCQSVLHDCKLTFLQIICDHDLFVEMPGRDPSDRCLIFNIYFDNDYTSFFCPGNNKHVHFRAVK